jgi:hypothetical protein
MMEARGQDVTRPRDLQLASASLAVVANYRRLLRRSDTPRTIIDTLSHRPLH